MQSLSVCGLFLLFACSVTANGEAKKNTLLVELENSQTSSLIKEIFYEYPSQEPKRKAGYLKKRLKEIEDRTRVAGGEIVKLFGNGSAFYAPAQSAIEMAESYIKDKKRVIPCASLCEGEFGIDGYFIGVPTVIGSGGVEKILEFTLDDNEKNELKKTLEAVKHTVAETGL